MGWRDHLQKDEEIVLPWTGGRSVRTGQREWSVEGRLPAEHGWFRFKSLPRSVRLLGEADPSPDILKWRVRGFLVGDRVVPDGARVDPDPARIAGFSEPVHLLEPGLERFARVVAGRTFEDGPLVFASPDMPVGPEDEVLRAFQDREASVDGIRGVTPALDAAFRMESWRRTEADKRRAEIERARLEEEARLAAEERRRALAERLGDAGGRRALAAVDFTEAARAALAVGGAEYLDHRRSVNRREMVVTFRLDGRRFECVCDSATLRIVDSGICLVDHNTKERGDDRFTLESLPGVILQSIRERRLHVFRHVDGGPEDDDGEEWD